MRRLTLTAVGVVISSVVFAAPASAKDFQLDTACDSANHVCVSAVHNGHYVKSITARIIDSVPGGSMQVRWGDFHRSTDDRKHTWNVEDKQGRARGIPKPLRHSDVICVTLDRLLSGGEKACVAI
jgi:hypothetical protein